MRLFTTLTLLAALIAFGAGAAFAKAPANHSGSYGYTSATSKGWLKLTQVKGATHQFEIMVYGKDGATCSMDGMIEIVDGLGMFKGTFQKCSFSLYFEKSTAMVDSGRSCDQCGKGVFIDGAYAKGKMPR